MEVRVKKVFSKVRSLRMRWVTNHWGYTTLRGLWQWIKAGWGFFPSWGVQDLKNGDRRCTKLGPIALNWLAVVALLAALTGCGSAAGGGGGSGSAGGNGGATAAAGGGSGGAGGQDTTTTTPPCVEPTPEGWRGPLEAWTGQPAAGNWLTTIADEAGGLAGTGPRIGPFVCPHDFTAIAVSYYVSPAVDMPVTPRVALVMAGVDGLPLAAPFSGDASVVTGECTTAGTPTCKIAIDADSGAAFVPVQLETTVHVEPGDVVYPTVQISDAGMGIAVTGAGMHPNPGWYYAPPGSGAGGELGLWAALDDPPPGVTSYSRAPLVGLVE